MGENVKHTPGPWSIDEQEYIRADVHDALALKAAANEQLAIANGQRAKEEHFRAEAAEALAEALKRENAEKDARIAALEKVLAMALHTLGVNENAIDAIVTALTLDGGERARALLGGSDAGN